MRSNERKNERREGERVGVRAGRGWLESSPADDNHDEERGTERERERGVRVRGRGEPKENNIKLLPSQLTFSSNSNSEGEKKTYFGPIA